MTLRPCPSCRRHVREDICVFCGTTILAAPRPQLLAGRLSRAAVFAGATLAGCSSSPAPRHAPPRPPPDDHAVASVDAGGSDDRAVRTFAAPPPDAAAVGTGIVRGKVTMVSGEPFRTRVFLRDAHGHAREILSDVRGRYEFRDLPAGDYTVSAQQPRPDNPRHGGEPDPRRVVKVTDGSAVTADLAIVPVIEPDERRPCCMPYGAPPARGRIV